MIRTSLEVKSVEDNDGKMTFSGYASTFGNVDHVGDVVEAGAYKSTIAHHSDTGTMPAMWLNHEYKGIPVGVWKSMREDAKGLFVEGELIDTAAGRDIYAALKAGAIKSLSIGYRVTGYEHKGGNRHITGAHLDEVSVVTRPVNEQAQIVAVKSLPDNLEAMLNDAGFSADAIAALMASRDDPQTEADDADKSVEATIETEENAKYDEAAIMAAIEKLATAMKETNV
ncbi:HK97 family phage prohead protease [Sphingomonas guangdongensis]|uniref:HK97 family phage prohead protease n=1 Tax=Sphingomonas guangdongensis TaxID=1141890 RepID=UPI0015CECB4C|nr:HK97 family phage prohead protease [Sphingomonas guangdongensis]